MNSTNLPGVDVHFWLLQYLVNQLPSVAVLRKRGTLTYHNSTREIVICTTVMY
jgi:hypothetical protein